MRRARHAAMATQRGQQWRVPVPRSALLKVVREQGAHKVGSRRQQSIRLQNDQQGSGQAWPSVMRLRDLACISIFSAADDSVGPAEGAGEAPAGSGQSL